MAGCFHGGAALIESLVRCWIRVIFRGSWGGCGEVPVIRYELFVVPLIIEIRIGAGNQRMNRIL